MRFSNELLNHCGLTVSIAVSLCDGVSFCPLHNFYPHMPIGKVWIYRLLFVSVFFVRLYGCRFLRRAGGVKFCTAVHRSPRQGISNFGELCFPRSPKSNESAIFITWILHFYNYYDNVMWLAGLIHLFTKSGRGVTLSASDQIIQAPNNESATTFLLTQCLAWNIVPKTLHARCVSLMDVDRIGWYFRHTGYYIRVDSQYVTHDLTLFQNDSSFILHPESFYSGYYSLESVNFRGWYIRLLDNGFLWIETEAFTTSYIDAASFTLYGYNTSSKYYCFIGKGDTALSDCHC